jgi:hypothetical protein
MDVKRIGVLNVSSRLCASCCFANVWVHPLGGDRLALSRDKLVDPGSRQVQ